MPWCPKCQTEYREGFDTCADCHVPLEGELSAEPIRSEPPPLDYGEPALLTTVGGVVEADMLLALLATQGVPAFKKSRGAGGYFSIYMGVAYTGVEIYVPQQLLTQALEIAEALHPPQDGEEPPAVEEAWPKWDEAPGEERDNMVEAEPTPHPTRTRVLLWLWLIGAIVAVLWQFTSFFSTLRQLFFG